METLLNRFSIKVHGLNDFNGAANGKNTVKRRRCNVIKPVTRNDIESLHISSYLNPFILIARALIVGRKLISQRGFISIVRMRLQNGFFDNDELMPGEGGGGEGGCTI